MDHSDSETRIPTRPVLHRSDLPFWIWAILPAAIWLAILPIEALSPEWTAFIFRNDLEGGGPVEHGTVVILLPGIVAGITVFLKALRSGRMQREKFWFLAWSLACIYFAGEEISWGQHFFHWSTPEAIVSLNDQGETNFHNMSSWLDQKPRALVEIWMILGGLVAPLWIRYRTIRFSPESWQHWIIPTIVCVPAVISSLLTRLFNVIDDSVSSKILDTLGDPEFREFFVAFFLTIYLLSAWYRQKNTPPADS